MSHLSITPVPSFALPPIQERKDSNEDEIFNGIETSIKKVNGRETYIFEKNESGLNRRMEVDIERLSDENPLAAAKTMRIFSKCLHQEAIALNKKKNERIQKETDECYEQMERIEKLDEEIDEIYERIDKNEYEPIEEVFQKVKEEIQKEKAEAAEKRAKDWQERKVQVLSTFEKIKSFFFNIRESTINFLCKIAFLIKNFLVGETNGSGKRN